jgi:hypothetical protein
MSAPTSLSMERNARSARVLCDAMGVQCDGKDMNIVVAALMGLISRLPTEVRVSIATEIMRTANVADVEIPSATQKQIDSIVKGTTHEQEDQPA